MAMLERVRLRELDRLLRRHSVEDAKIPWFSPAKRQRLAAVGVTTAAEVTREALGRVPDLSGTLVKALLDWRSGIELQIEIDPVRLATGQDRELLRRVADSRRQELEEGLRSGLATLKELEAVRARQRPDLLEALGKAAARVAQARADVAVLG
jgi:DNA-binding helix-hairpin-helix protein with protein kinase domain